ncbi:myotubularin-related protein DDB_G0290005-like [Portunus trituberculatus]|uniref:myotubularin-related protein DDB_G0290005-like n=1 Tax=Portunus trituberculatus TaxID=210409 RepID=UPI001E1D110A|nr:myotubularin-related protein DDB_G0290005-like [Portunus trituberculatus]
MRAWTISLAVAVMVCSLMCLVKGTTAAPRISSQQLWDMAVAGEDEDYKEGRKWGDKDEDGNDKEDTNEENKKREERNVNQPQNGVLARVGREACPQHQQDPLGQILNLVSHSVLVTSLAITLINNINNNNNNDNNNNNNDNNNNLNNNDLTVNVVNMNMNEASLRRGFRSVRGAGRSSRHSDSKGHHAHLLSSGILSGALEDASLSLLTSKSSSNNTMSQSGASSSPENVTIHFSSTHQGKAAGNPWMQCVSWGVCVRLTQAAIASPAAWVTENLAISVLELEIGQFMTEELQVALRRAILLGRREEYCEPLKMGCSWENFTVSGVLNT